jgi:hypothetical protein
VSLVTPAPILGALEGRRRGVGVSAIALAGWLAGQILAVVAASVAIRIAGTHLSIAELQKLAEPPTWFIATTLLGLWAGWSVGMLVVHRRFHVIDRSAFEFHARDLWLILLAPALQFVIALTYLAFGVHNTSGPTKHLLGSASGLSLVVISIMTIIGAPFFEEMLFRGTLLAGLRGLFSSHSIALTAVCSILLDGFIFGAGHGELLQLPALTALGCLLAWIYWRTGRLWPCFILHGSFNAIGVISTLVVVPHL